jgi:hypothetical protein
MKRHYATGLPIQGLGVRIKFGPFIDIGLLEGGISELFHGLEMCTRPNYVV